jgi:hypothetical protein
MSKTCAKCDSVRLVLVTGDDWRLVLLKGEDWECPDRFYWYCLDCLHVEEANPNDARTHEGEENGPQIA